jgi:hypothetical protein
VKLWRTLLLGSTIFILTLINARLLRQRDFFPELGGLEDLDSDTYSEHNVFKVEIQWPEGSILLKKEKKWKMIQPFPWPVNPFAVQEFFQILERNPTIPPGMNITLSKKNGQKMMAYSPNSSKDTTEVSVRHPLEMIMKQNIHFWCQQKLCPLNPHEINSLSLTFHEKEQKFLLVKRDDLWSFTHPFGIEANAFAVQEILDWIGNLEVVPDVGSKFFQNIPRQGKDTDESLSSKGEPSPLNSESLSKKPYLTITLTDNRHQYFTMICNYLIENQRKKPRYYAWLNNHDALFWIPLIEALDRPFQSLCSQFFFPEIKSAIFSYKQQKLFLSCNESGEWSAFNFSKLSQSLQPLEHFDIQTMLLYLSLMKPLDIIARSKIPDTISGEKFLLEINGALKFEFFNEENIAYLLPIDKNYAVMIAGHLFKKIFEVIKEIEF